MSAQSSNENKGLRERTLLIVKPDGVSRGLIGEILGRFERKGLNMVACKLITATKAQLEAHYEEHVGRDYFPGILSSTLNMGPMFVFVMEGPVGTVDFARKMLGKTDPMKSEPGTIRGDLCVSTGRNVCHASDSVTSATREISIWFTEGELVNYTPNNAHLLYRE
ncbi:nucleoside diphosphate kinase-like [Yasminevirus sp. GU-2018]|uniref:nucleoside-diphosphate kinase n=1 Tax=Yasminevirus sp. GU-2018 TaxID=2420051 RepID=A0A5K0U9W3_9VIRU|nr:nucleoside diphosphate kinase-like [Yasminevirus sp. GU-2018]